MNTRRDERGSILPMTVFLVVVVLAFTAFAVDLGLKRAARSDMQSVADVVALDMARHIAGRTKAAIETDPQWVQTRNRSVARNRTTIGSAPVVTSELGRLDATTGVFSTVAASDVPTAVKITAGTTVDFTFTSGSGSTARTAVATVDPGACFSVGSFAAALNTSDGALDKLLGPIVGVSDLKVLGSGGIAALSSLQVPLLGLATQLGVGTANDLVTTNTTVGAFVAAAANVLTSQGDTAGANLLNAIKAKLALLPIKPLKVGDILDLSAGGDAALKLGVNVLDLVAGSLLVANGSNALAVPDLGLTLPGLTAINTKATIVGPPKIACGRAGATARSSQAKLELTAEVGGIVSSIAGASIKLNIDVAAAQGTLRALRCGAATGNTLEVDAMTALVQNLKLHLDIRVLGSVLGSLVKADVTAPSIGTAAPKSVTLTYPVSGSPLPSQSVSGITSLNLAGADIDGSVAGLPLGGLLNTLVKPVLVALDPLLVGLLTPTLKLLGVSLGGAEVAAVGPIDCNAPQLNG